MTISIAAFAGPSPAILQITVIVINAPIAPPSSRYHGFTRNKSPIGSLPVMHHAARQTANALICTQPAASHVLVCFVTSVLKTP